MAPKYEPLGVAVSHSLSDSTSVLCRTCPFLFPCVKQGIKRQVVIVLHAESRVLWVTREPQSCVTQICQSRRDIGASVPRILEMHRCVVPLLAWFCWQRPQSWASGFMTATLTQRRQSYMISLATDQESAPRSGNTAVDLYYQLNRSIPSPQVPHAVLDITQDVRRRNFLFIGDIHGCLEELQELISKAVEANEGRPFQAIVCTGDLVNKGPYSAQVVQYIRQRQQAKEPWLVVRGNHDNGALHAALGDAVRLAKPKYASWIHLLTDDDVHWLSELPYTISIPPAVLNDDFSTVVVHAGLLPGVPLTEQSIETMTTLRNLPSPKQTGADTAAATTPWLEQWDAHLQSCRVIFGHDALRQLQLGPRTQSRGLDTGCVYGGSLTGLVLPGNVLVQVAARRVYTPVGADE
jgi:bis(5'-nucleosyl)-tetraphosphatase (symmetrical)